MHTCTRVLGIKEPIRLQESGRGCESARHRLYTPPCGACVTQSANTGAAHMHTCFALLVLAVACAYMCTCCCMCLVRRGSGCDACIHQREETLRTCTHTAHRSDTITDCGAVLALSWAGQVVEYGLAGFLEFGEACPGPQEADGVT